MWPSQRMCLQLVNCPGASAGCRTGPLAHLPPPAELSEHLQASEKHTKSWVIGLFVKCLKQGSEVLYFKLVSFPDVLFFVDCFLFCF